MNDLIVVEKLNLPCSSCQLPTTVEHERLQPLPLRLDVATRR